jgi:hypothetical protein
MPELTLVHEDIYVYVDPIAETSENKTAANSFSFSNDSTEQVAELGVFTIDILSGSYTKLTIAAGGKTATFNTAMATGNKLVLDFRNMNFKKGSTLLFADDIPVVTDNATTTITVTLTGTGSAKVTRVYEKATTNNNDIWFVEGVSVDTSFERPKKTFLSGEEKVLKGEKKVHSFSINGIWNRAEVSKFTDKFRLRLVDIDGSKLETLASCRKESVAKSSSSNGDLTFTISGSCEKIF